MKIEMNIKSQSIPAPAPVRRSRSTKAKKDEYMYAINPQTSPNDRASTVVWIRKQALSRSSATIAMRICVPDYEDFMSATKKLLVKDYNPAFIYKNVNCEWRTIPFAFAPGATLQDAMNCMKDHGYVRVGQGWNHI